MGIPSITAPALWVPYWVKHGWLEHKHWDTAVVWWLRRRRCDLWVESVYRRETLDKGGIHAPGRIEWEGMRFQHTTQNGVKFKTCKLSISEISHFLFLARSGPRVTETSGSESAAKRALLSCFPKWLEGIYVFAMVPENMQGELQFMSPRLECHHAHLAYWKGFGSSSI